MKKRRSNKGLTALKLESFKTYAKLKAFSLAHEGEFSAAEKWTIVEKMRQLRHGYKPGELKLDRKNIEIRQYTLAEFREKTENEYQEEIRKYGPR